jgi:shikimate dehydrogenase
MHGAAFRALGMDHTYEKIETAEAELPARIDALRRGEFGGLNVTVPHKQRVMSLVDEAAASARVIGAANTLVRSSDGRVVAHNTDAGALAAEIDFVGRAALVIGSGGAAHAAVAALGSLGFARVFVRARAPADSLDVIGHHFGIEVVLQPLAPSPDDDENLRCIIQATSCGMTGAAPGEIVADAVAWGVVPQTALAIDVVYAPRDTPFLRAARARGIDAKDGLGMLARQGALAFELWLGVKPPLDVMLAAIA